MLDKGPLGPRYILIININSSMRKVFQNKKKQKINIVYPTKVEPIPFPVQKEELPNNENLLSFKSVEYEKD